MGGASSRRWHLGGQGVGGEGKCFEALPDCNRHWTILLKQGPGLCEVEIKHVQVHQRGEFGRGQWVSGGWVLGREQAGNPFPHRRNPFRGRGYFTDTFAANARIRTSSSSCLSGGSLDMSKIASASGSDAAWKYATGRSKACARASIVCSSGILSPRSYRETRGAPELPSSSPSRSPSSAWVQPLAKRACRRRRPRVVAAGKGAGIGWQNGG